MSAAASFLPAESSLLPIPVTRSYAPVAQVAQVAEVAPVADSVWLAPLPRALLTMALAVIGLNLVDAFGTLRHLAYGAEELNPLMLRLLNEGPVTFVVGKHALACGGIIGIMAHAKYRAAGIALNYVLFPVYLAIATYQIILLGVIQ